MPEDNVIAGVACSEVLAHLSDFVDGALESSKVEALHAHLAACEHCAKFGAEFQAALGSLKTRLRNDEPLAEDIAERLMARLSPEE